jgi:hypothetical protein
VRPPFTLSAWSAGTADERRNADLFYAALLGLRGSARYLRDERDFLRHTRHPLAVRQPPAEWYAPEIVEVCGFFGPNNVRRTELEVRDAVVARANAEWAAWHDTAGAPRLEGAPDMFGRLVGYYLGANGSIPPDTLTAMQSAALGSIDYAPLLASAANATTIAAEAARLRGLLLAGAPGATAAGLTTKVENAITQARQAHAHAGAFKAWSAAFVSTCVRGAGVTQGLEGVIGPGRQHVGRDTLLLASLMHAGYTVQARTRRAARLPRRQGTYHAFTPAERAPQRGDIIVQDRRDGITVAQVARLATLRSDLITHGDIVVDVQEPFVVTIGGNVGDSARKRRYPRTAQGFLVVDRQQMYTQENDAGTLPDLPSQTNAALAGRSTARIFALLSPVEECAAVPGQPYGGGVLT